jgi:hypothetical protein
MDSARGLFTVLFVKDHEVVRRFVDINQKAQNRGEVTESALIDSFASQGGYVIVYPYVKERELSRFYMGGALSLYESEEVCINFIIACMTAQLPWPVLYLLLRQGKVNLSRDKTVYFSYSADLTELDETIMERECVVECAAILVKILEPKADSKANSYILLQKKVSKRSYTRFTELYKDVQIAAVPKRRRGLLIRFRVWFDRNKDTLFRILLVICVLLALFVIISFLTYLIIGDVPWLRLFIRSFERIGLESLLQ